MNPILPVTEPVSTVRVALVEDDIRVRQGLAYLIGNSPGFQWVADFGSAEEALQNLERLQPNVVLMDINLPGMNGIDCIRLLKRILPSAQLVMLTVFEDDDRIFQSLAAGATGYLLKNTAPEQLLSAIREVSRGGAPMSAQIARRVVQAFRVPDTAEGPGAKLSPREHEILALLARGFLYKEIADHLKLSVETVRTHIRNIYDKLHVRSRTEAVMKIYGR